MRRLLRAAVAAAVAVTFCGHGFAQEYPTHTITLIVPYPPGGGVDAMARVVAEKLAGALGQQVVVDITAPAARAWSALAPSSRARPTGTRCFSATPDRSPSIPASTPMPASTPARTSHPSG